MAIRGAALVLVLGLCLLYSNGKVMGESSDGEPSDRWQGTDHNIDLSRLMLQLLMNYHSLAIPSTPLNVSYGLNLVSIDGVDEKEKILRFSAFASIVSISKPTDMRPPRKNQKESWLDPRLQWNPDDYEGVVSFNLPVDKIWQPDLRLHAQVLEKEDVNVHIYHDGKIYHYLPLRLALPCSMEFAKYPFDTQICSLRLESWVYDRSMVDLTPNQKELGAGSVYYRVNSQWQIQSFTAIREETKYICCPDSFVSLSYHIRIKRTVGEYAVRVLAPSVLTSLLLLLCFLIPSNRSERLVLCGILLLCVLLQLFHLNLTVPISGPDAPFLADFLCFSVFLAFFAAVESVVAINLSGCLRGSSSDNARPVDGEGFVMADKPNTGMTSTRVARFMDAGCFIIFTFIFAVAGGIILNPAHE